MRYALISDIHANLEALTVALADIRKRSIDQIVCLGDVTNYGADPVPCLKRIREAASAILLGNHEVALLSDEMADLFNPYAREALLWTREQLSTEDKHWLATRPLTMMKDDWMAVHATPETPDAFEYLFDMADALRNFRSMEAPICFYGHTHVPLLFAEYDSQAVRLPARNYALDRTRRYIINVGSVGQPRDGDPRLAYTVFDEETWEVELVRLSYDVKAAQRKIENQGLPSMLAERLAYGQ